MIQLKKNTFLASAFRRATNYPMEVDDHGSGPLWLIGNEFGNTHVVRAETCDAAWSVMVDSCPTVADDCLHEAYGKKRIEFAVIVRSWSTGGDEISLAPGYEYQSGGGVASVGRHVWCRHLTEKDCQDIRLVIREDSTVLMPVTVHLSHAAYSLEIVTDSGAIKIKSFPSYKLPFEARLRKLERAAGALSVTVRAAS